jgi:DNA-directed RNA polymerase subunit RPC12/RpoP
MMGSGIYASDVTLEVTCPECEHVWEEDFVTDDWGDVEDDMVCSKCAAEFTFSRERE